jgi:acetyl esterase
MKITDPEVLCFIENTESVYPASANQASPEENRRYYDKWCEEFKKPCPDGVKAIDNIISKVATRRYVAADTSDTRPFVLYLHGGGFMVGSLDSHDDICEELCDRTGLEVISVDYRLAPEHVYPTQLDDAETVWNAVTSEGRSGIVMGDSAGGMLAAALCMRIRRLATPAPLAQILMYPVLGGQNNLPSYSENADAPLLRSLDVLYYSRVYTGGMGWSDTDDEELSPLVAKSFVGLPPTFVVTADVDPLRDDGTEFVEQLSLAGIDAVCRNEPELVHGFLRARHSSKRAKESFDSIVNSVIFFARS